MTALEPIVRDPSDPRLVALARELAADNPGRQVVVDEGAVWIRDAAGRREHGIYSRIIIDERIVCCFGADGMTSLHRDVAQEVGDAEA